MQDKNNDQGEYFFEIISHFNNDFDKEESLFPRISTNIIADRVFSIINKTGTRLSYVYSYYIALERKEELDSTNRYKLQGQFTDYIGQFILESSGLITQAHDYVREISKDKKLSKKIKNMKTVLDYDSKINFLGVLRDTFAHYEKDRDYDFAEFMNKIALFNLSIKNESNNFDHPHIGLKKNVPEGFKYLSNINSTVSWVKINATEDRLNKYYMHKDFAYIFDDYDIKNDSKETYELARKDSIQFREVCYNFDYNLDRGTNDVNNWYALIQVTDELCLKIKLYPMVYSMLKIMSELMNDELTRLENKKPEE